VLMIRKSFTRTETPAIQLTFLSHPNWHRRLSPAGESDSTVTERLSAAIEPSRPAETVAARKRWHCKHPADHVLDYFETSIAHRDAISSDETFATRVVSVGAGNESPSLDLY
jgi:hypothetical protein